MSTQPIQANKELVHEYLETIEDQDLDRIPEFFADDFTVDMMQLDEGGSEEKGVEAIVEGVKETFEAFPDLSHDLKEMAAEDDWVLFRVNIEGTHNGEYKGIEPTGKEVSWQMHQSFRIEDGEFVEHHGTLSFAWLLSQLGVDLPIETGD